MRYINILTVGSNTHIPQSITAVCQLDILYFSETFHFNYRYTSRHYVQVRPLCRQKVSHK